MVRVSGDGMDSQRRRNLSISGLRKELLQMLERGPVSYDDIQNRFGSRSKKALNALETLEEKGVSWSQEILRSCGGSEMRFYLIRASRT